MQANKLNYSFSEKDYGDLSKGFATDGNCDSFILKYLNVHNDLSYNDVISLALSSAISNNYANLCGYLLSLDFDGIALTTLDQRNLSPMSIALSTNTSEDILSLLRYYIDTHTTSFTKVAMDPNTLKSFSFSVYGGEFFTKEATINTYLEPLFDDVDITTLLGNKS